MFRNTYISKFLLVLLVELVTGRVAEQNDNAPQKKPQEILDPHGDYKLSWSVDLAKSKIIFEVEAAGKGYVGFGISPGGSMQGTLHRYR